MTIDTNEIIELLSILCKEQQLQITIRESVKGGLIVGIMSATGGLLGGPIGLAAGGVIGSCIAAGASRNKFMPAVAVIANMPPEQREVLANIIRNIMGNIDATDITSLAAIIAGNTTIRNKVLNALMNFLTTEMSIDVVDN